MCLSNFFIFIFCVYTMISLNSPVFFSLNEEQINKLSEVKNVSPVLKEMHELK
ncbi:hypothetical protein NSTCB13_03459 [Nostoc sp. DSM 114160]|jgi:hypothetical protein